MKRQQLRAARRRNRDPSPDTAACSGERKRSLLLGGLIAVYVARPLLPSEAPTTSAGDGLPFVMLTLILAVAWLLTQLASPARLRFGIAEGAWLALLVWQAVGTGLATRSGYGRAAINTFWEWAGLGIGYVLLRQLLQTDREKRAIMVVMIGVALVLSLDGIQEFAVETPATRAYYELHPDKVLKELRIHAPPGSAARRLFEERLRSSEPTATFALANSLAGFLTPWLLASVALVFCPTHDHRRLARLVAVLSALPMAACLVLTKSRAGYLAAILGFATLLFLWRRRGRRTWRIVAGSVAVGALLIAVGVACGALDRQIISQALKSLSYRRHYWHGAWCLVKEHPWFGCGLGNFQDEYTQYKLPLASEVVADPHNLLFEVWATAGTPALAALVAIFIGAASQWRRTATRSSPAAESSEPAASLALRPTASLALRVGVDDQQLGAGSTMAPLWGAIGGFLLAFAVGSFTTIGLPWPVLLAGCLILPLLFVLSSSWVEAGPLPHDVPFVAGLALMVNLLVAGGISFAGVAGSLWLLLAIGARDDQPRSPLTPPRWVVIGSCAVVAALFVVCYLTAYRPMLGCRRLIAQAEDKPATARERLQAAIKADPLADEPWRQLAAGEFALWQREPTAELADAWQHAQQEVLGRRPHSSAAWLEAAERYFAAYRRANEAQRPVYLSAALDHFQRAAELYPNYAMVHAEWALALAAAGRSEAADEAELALSLHQQTPHKDLKLPDDLLPALSKLVLLQR